MLPADIYYCICEQISDPLSYRNFLLTCKLFNDLGSRLRDRKKKEFFAHESVILEDGSLQCITSFLFCHPIRSRITVYSGVDAYIQSKDNCVAGLREGICKTYHERGVLSTRSIYRGGKKHGASIKYYVDGKIENCYNYKDDIEHGPFALFYSDGTKRTEGSFFEGEYDGEWRQYNLNGKIKYRYIYQRGKSILTEYYTRDGKLQREVRSRN